MATRIHRAKMPKWRSGAGGASPKFERTRSQALLEKLRAFAAGPSRRFSGSGGRGPGKPPAPAALSPADESTVGVGGAERVHLSRAAESSFDDGSASPPGVLGPLAAKAAEDAALFARLGLHLQDAFIAAPAAEAALPAAALQALPLRPAALPAAPPGAVVTVFRRPAPTGRTAALRLVRLRARVDFAAEERLVDLLVTRHVPDETPGERRKKGPVTPPSAAPECPFPAALPSRKEVATLADLIENRRVEEACRPRPDGQENQGNATD